MQNTIELLSLLYELSLTTVKNEEPSETGRKFIKKFVARKNLQYAAAWKLTSTDGEDLQFQRIYSIPKITESAKVPVSIFNELPSPNTFRFRKTSLFKEVKMEGTFAYFRLERFGLLELFERSETPQVLTKEKLYPFVDVLNQFASNLAAGYLKLASVANEEKYRRIIDNIHLGLLEVDRNEVIQFANRSFLDLVGYEMEEILGQKASDLFVDDENRAVIDQENARRQEGESSSYELSILDRHGNKKWAIISGAPNYNHEGDLIGSIGIHLDITEEKLLKRENEFRTQQLQKLFEQSLDALLSIDAEGKIFEWSPQAEKIFGYSREEVHGKMLKDCIIPHQYREAHENGMKHYHATGEGPVLNSRIEITALRKDGTEFPIELTIFPIDYEDTTYFTAFIRDITEFKEAKTNMEQALERQKELNQLKSQFVSMTSHELRTPLTTIIGNTELISFQLENKPELNRDKLRKNILRIEQNTDRLNQLISNILLAGQLESNRLPFEPRRMLPHEFIEESILPDYHSRGVVIPHHVQGKARQLELDKNLFTHIITNLLENAIKYTLDGESPEIATKYYEKSVQIAVKDHGVGIPEPDQEKLFQSFFRASNVGNIKGTGLGLSIVGEFVKLHGGAIKVNSKVGVGSTFTLYFPLEHH